MCYAYLLFSLELIHSDNNETILGMLICLAVVFWLYLLSGYCRIYQYGTRASRVRLILVFSLAYSVIACSYWYIVSYVINEKDSRWKWNLGFVVLSIIIMIAYRITHSLLAYRSRWIAIDVDGVLANQIAHLLPIIDQKYGKQLKYEDIVEWDLKIGNTDIASVIRAEQQQKRYVQKMPPILNASESINRLIRKFKIAIVTARSPDSDEWTKNWLVANGIPYDSYINTKEGHKHNIDVDHELLVDDYLGNIQKYLEKSDGLAILFDQPWNRERSSLRQYMEDGRLLVAKDWDDVLAKIEKMMKSK